MTPRLFAAGTVVLLVFTAFSLRTPRREPCHHAHDKRTRMSVIRRSTRSCLHPTPFPMGEKGLRLRDGVVSRARGFANNAGDVWTSVKRGIRLALATLLFTTEHYF